MKYLISDEEKNGKFRFKIYPPNSRIQSLGVSPWYSTAEECENAKNNFLILIYTEKIDNLNENYIKIQREAEKSTNNTKDKIYRYKFYYYDNDKNLILYRKRSFNKMYNCIKCISSIYNAVIENYKNI